MSGAIDDGRVQRILEACYDAICAGSEPDLGVLCAHAPELRAPIERMLRRERQLLEAASGDGLPLATAGPPADGAPPALPRQIGEFVVQDAIGIGGMSHVFRARQEPLGREVALKVLREDLVSSATSRLRFAREASITASLEHPNIVPVYAAGEADGRVYLAMKLLRGRSLDQHDTPMQPQTVARIGCDVAAALQAAHDVGVVHRDLKPANIVVENGHAVVVDFGLAAFANQQSLLTQPNATPGTLIYLPPEVARRRATGLDPRADVYGLGATLYELLAGHPPFDPSNPVRALQQILHQEPRSLELRGADRDLETIVRRAMDKVPTRRFQTAGELLDELQRYRNGQPIRTRRPNVAVRALRTMQRHPTTSTLIALSLLLAAVLLLQTLWQHRIDVDTLERRVAATERALQAGELVAARGYVDEIAAHPLGGRAIAAAERHWQQERDLQVLIAGLQHPILRGDERFLGALVARLDEGAPRHASADEPSPRQLAAVALARGGGGDAQGADVPPAVERELPRTAAALHALRRRGAIPDALAALADRSGGAWDHLLAAAVMRLAETDERLVERELRRADRTGEAALLFESLRLSLTAQGRHREAYDLALQALAHPITQVPARWAAARLAAMIGDEAAADEHLRAARRAAPADPLLQVLAVPSQLEVLSELDPDAFWTCWHTAPESCRELAQYWRLAGYVASDGPTLDDVQRARGYFERALECAERPAVVGGLRAALLQLEWRRLLQVLAERPDDEAAPAAMQALAAAGEALVADAEAQQLPRTVVADALLTAAQARTALGEPAHARRLFDRAADLGDPVPLAEFAWTVAVRCLDAMLFDEGFADPTLTADARVALERARRVLSPADDARAARGETRAVAHDAALVCAAWLNDATLALPLAVSWQPTGGPADDDLQRLVDALLAGGGVVLASFDAHDPAAVEQLEATVAALGRAWRNGTRTTSAVRQVIAHWRAHERLREAIESPAWQPFREAVEALEQQLKQPR